MVVSIGRIKWEARFVPQSGIELNTGSGLNGCCAPTSHQIFISNGMDEQQTRDTTIHEVTHAYIEQYLLAKKSFDYEELCNFMERYAEDIIETANEILKGFSCK
jgi:hypothetical protein